MESDSLIGVPKVVPLMSKEIRSSVKLDVPRGSVEIVSSVVGDGVVLAVSDKGNEAVAATFLTWDEFAAVMDDGMKMMSLHGKDRW